MSLDDDLFLADFRLALQLPPLLDLSLSPPEEFWTGLRSFWSEHSPLPREKPVTKNRLGKYFEELLCFGLQHYPDVQNVTKGLVISKNRQSLGELDFLFTWKNQISVHWEVALKFFLRFGKSGNYADWIGPSGRDRLDWKVNHLLQKQIELSKTPDALAVFRERGLRPPEAHWVWVTGMVFVPHASPEKEVGLSTTAKQGVWFWESQKESLMEFAKDSQKFVALSRTAWLGWESPPIQAWNFLEFQRFLHTEASLLSPLMIQAWKGEEGSYWESFRAFLLPEKLLEVYEKLIELPP